MLVLSRKPQEQIVLPTLGVTVQVLAVKGHTVRLGIDAPPDVPIRRAELPDRAAEWGPPADGAPGRAATAGACGPDPLRLRGRLATTGVGLGLLRLLLDAGQTEDARATLAALQQDLQLLLHGLDGEADGRPPSPRRQKALLVEDDGNQRELLAGFLRQSGLEVDTAGDGGDALDYLRSHAKPDVVLLDMGLPRVDGPTTVRAIRRDPAYAGLKIFGVSGHRPDELGLECGPAGVDRWFRKPFDPDALLHDLHEELNAPCGV